MVINRILHTKFRIPTWILSSTDFQIFQIQLRTAKVKNLDQFTIRVTTDLLILPTFAQV
jgi:hypothetical protein